jgi:hypothetical protein
MHDVMMSWQARERWRTAQPEPRAQREPDGGHDGGAEQHTRADRRPATRFRSQIVASEVDIGTEYASQSWDKVDKR